jgi:hypothetical protein
MSNVQCRMSRVESRNSKGKSQPHAYSLVRHGLRWRQAIVLVIVIVFGAVTCVVCPRPTSNVKTHVEGCSKVDLYVVWTKACLSSANERGRDCPGP